MKSLLIAILVSAVGLATLHATTVVPADLGVLSREARAIARGRVASVESRWTEGRRSIETLVTLDVERYLKGDLGTAPVFRVPGGRLGRFRSITVGAPEFEVGQRVIVFLGAREPRLPFVLGLNQGVYRMMQSGGGWNVNPPPVLPAPSSALRVGPLRVVRGDRSRTSPRLADFEQRVQTLAGSR